MPSPLHSSRDLIVATTNPGKLREIEAVLADCPVQLRCLADYAPVAEPVEDGATFLENARIKALAYSLHFQSWVLADDSGLQVDALDGRPGVISARYAGSDSPDRAVRDRANLARVLEEMQGIDRPQRTARFRCCLCLAEPGRVLLEVDGSLEGSIHDEPLGSNGFGYDPIVWLEREQCTVAQLSDARKNALSHRGLALKKLANRLTDLLTLSAKTAR